MGLIAIMLALALLILLAVFGPSDFTRRRDVALRVLSTLCAVFVLLLAGCAGKGTKPDIPRGIIVQPKVVEVVRKEYVNVPPTYTDPLPIAEGPLSQCPVVAAERKKALKKANTDRASVRALSGTQVKP